MAKKQHQGAENLLGIIESMGPPIGTLTYRSAAERMGVEDYESYSRAVAQMCDLLDAAACLAGVPLLALVAVRDEHGKVNPKAWTRNCSNFRDKVIARSEGHEFSPADFEAIRRGLRDLNGLGNRRAWALVHEKFGDSLCLRITGGYPDAPFSAFDDLGTDDPARALYVSYTYLRDPKVRSAVLKRASGKCEHCGEAGFLKQDGSRYLETHHVIALAREGSDKLTNVIALCPNDHRKAHFSDERNFIEREMIQKLHTLNSPNG